MNRQTAIDGARREVSQKISTTIFSSSTQSTFEQSGNIQDEFSARTSAISMLTLQGLSFIPKQKRDGSYNVLAYISKDDLQASFRLQKQRQLESWRALQGRAPLNNLPNRLIGDVFDMYVQTYLYPYALYGPIENGQAIIDSANIALYYEQSLNSFLEDLTILVKDAQETNIDDQTLLEVTFEVFRKDESIKEFVQIRPIYPDYNFQHVRAGEVTVFLDRLPTTTTLEIPIEVRVFNEALNSELNSLAAQVSPTMTLTASVDVSSLVDVAITTQNVSETGFSFFPRLSALNVESLQWSLNGEPTSTQPTLSLLVSDVSEGDELTLTINDDQSLSHTLNYSSGQWLERIKARNISSASIQRASDKEQPSVEASVTFEAAPIIEDLKSIRNGVLLVNRLNQLSNLGLIEFGNQRNVPSQRRSYVVIVNPNSRSVEDILSPITAEQRIGLLSKKTFSDYKSNYRGYGSIFIFVN